MTNVLYFFAGILLQAKKKKMNQIDGYLHKTLS